MPRTTPNDKAVLSKGSCIGTWTLGALVGMASLTAFLPSFENGFVNWDDTYMVIDNTHLRGFGWPQLRWMFTSRHFLNYQPLGWLSYAWDYHLWGLEPAGYHLTSLLIHCLCVIIFYLISLRLLACARPVSPGGEADLAWAAAFAALLFGVHPLRVESVVWASERRDVLAGFFYLAAIYLYLRAVPRGSWIPALGVYLLALLCKGSVVTLPAALVVLDVYPLRRLPADPGRWMKAACRGVLLEKIPFAVLAAAGAMVNLAAPGEPGGMFVPKYFGAAERMAQACFGLVFYVWKTILPRGLQAFYATPQPFDPLARPFLLSAAGLIFIAAGLLALCRRWPSLLAVSAFYVATLSPSLGVVRIGGHMAADRYSYLPCLGFALLAGAGLRESLRRGRGRVLALTAAASILAALGWLSWVQCGVWRDSITLWSASVALEPSAIALNNLGDALVDAGRPQEGLARFEEAVVAFPESSLGYDHLGVMLYRNHQDRRARDAWRWGLALDQTPELHDHLGVSLAQGDGPSLREGIIHLRAAVAQSPLASYRVDLADALARAGQPAQAEALYASAVALDPEAAWAQNNWGLLLAGQGRADEALYHYRLALRSTPDRAQAQYNWGNVLLAGGRLHEAERRYREALRIEPGLAIAQVNLGNILAKRGDLAEAAVRYRAALKKDPGLYEARVNLSTVRRALGR